MEYAIQTENLTKQYRTKLAVDSVSMHVRKGDIYGLIGKNGAGKTTLMKLMLGLCVPTRGSIRLFGGENLNEARHKIGSLIEAPGLYDDCTAEENMRRFCILYGVDKREIVPTLEVVGLADTGAKKVKQFSLGMRQRLGMAIALLGRPEVLIMDEPVNGLDPMGIKDFRDIVLRLHGEGVTFVISSHLLDELAKVVTCYGILVDGVLTEEISMHDLKERCRKFVRIAGPDNEAIFRALRARDADMDMELCPDGVHMAAYFDKTAQINRYLTRNGVDVSEIYISGDGFENYFVERLR